MELITQLICKKNKIFYILFDKDYKMIDFNDALIQLLDDASTLKIGSDVRDCMWELIGLEEDMMQLFCSNDAENQTIHIPMIMKNNNYYDLDIETFTSSTKEKNFIAYIVQKPKESLRYIEMMQEVNKRTLVYEQENKDFKKLLSFNVDLNGIIIRVNNTFSYFFDKPDNEIIGSHFSTFFQARDLNFHNKNTIIFNAKNLKNEVISFHADIIPVSEDGVVNENIIICQDITYLKQIEKELKYAAEHDSLTGLLNRSQLLKKIDKTIDISKNNNSHFSICFIDLDKFKSVNDTYGHHAGDMLLKHVATLLSNFAREDDLVARIGGDEFIILFNSMNKLDEIKNILQRLYKIPLENPLIYTDADIIEYGFSIGVATYPDDASTAQELLKIADKAMYKNKKREEVKR